MSVNLLKLKLPAEYQEVEYIESTGTQYIDTGYYPNQDTRVVVDYQDVDITLSTHAMVGVRNISTSPSSAGFGFGGRSSHYWYAQYNEEQTPSQIFLNDTNRHVVDFNKRQLYFDNNLIHTFSQQTFTSPSALTIFRWANENNTFSASKIYSCKIYNNDSLVRDFVPCYRKSDNEIGLYDLVNGVFYTNAGTDTFSKGSNVTNIEVQPVKKHILVNGARIPNEYQEVEYVQSSGTQYIDTGIKLSSSDTVKCKFEITARPNDYNYRDGVYGTMETQNGTNTFFVLLMRDPNQARVGTSANQASSTNLVLNTVYDTTLSNGTYIENGTTYTFTPHSGFTFTTSCWFFRRNQSAMLATSAKVYSFEIVGKFNGVPCYRKSDNVVGFYDLVSDTFFTNAGTGTFSKGSDVSALVQKRVKSVALQQIIPDEYRRVEYLESTGTQYIDTGLKPDSNTDIDFKYSYTTTSLSSTETRVFGSRGSGNSKAFFIGLHSSYNYCWYINYGDTSNTLQSIIWGTVDTNPHIIKNNSGAFYFDNVNVMNFSVNSYTSPYNAIIFGANADGTIRTTKARVYYCKIYNQGNLVRDFLPCYRKADNVAGLYDTVTGTFYTNAGTGTFLVGAEDKDLPNEYQQVEYIESTGTQYIDTNVIPNQDTRIVVDFSVSQYLTTSNTCLFAGRDTSSNNSFTIMFGGGLQLSVYKRLYSGYNNENVYTPETFLDINTRYTIDKNKNITYLDSVQIYNSQYHTFTSPYSMYLFACHQTSSDLFCAYTKLYSCKIYNNTVLVRDYIPCYKKSNNEIGLFDLVNGVFYTNAGTGNFVVGSSVSSLPAYKIIKY